MIVELLIPYFILGLGGGLHCIAMCGPLALGLPTIGANKLGILLWHLGRIVSYAALGFACGLFGHLFLSKAVTQIISLCLGLALLLIYLLPKKSFKISFLDKFFSNFNRLFADVFKKYQQNSFFMLGLLHGLMPCGLIYAALFLAIKEANPLVSGLGMAVFALASNPGLLLLSFGANIKGFKNFANKFNKIGILILALWLIYTGSKVFMPEAMHHHH